MPVYEPAPAADIPEDYFAWSSSITHATGFESMGDLNAMERARGLPYEAQLAAPASLAPDFRGLVELVIMGAPDIGYAVKVDIKNLFSTVFRTYMVDPHSNPLNGDPFMIAVADTRSPFSLKRLVPYSHKGISEYRHHTVSEGYHAAVPVEQRQLFDIIQGASAMRRKRRTA